MKRKKIEISDENGRERITRENLHIFDEMTDEEAAAVFDE